MASASVLEIGAHCPLCHRAADLPSLRFREVHSDQPLAAGRRFACTSERAGSHGAIYWCRECQVGYSPAPDRDWLLAQYATVEDAQYFDEEEHRLRNATDLLKVIERRIPPGTLLEIGSAAGTFLSAAVGRGWKARGIETSAWAVSAGRSRYGVELEVGTVETSEQPLEGADCVVMADVLEHLVDPQAALQRCRDWLVPGGILAVTTVNMTTPMAHLLGTRWPGYMDMHLTYFSPAALRAMLARAGLESLSMRGAPRRLSVGYIGGRLRGSRRMADAAALVAQCPGLRRLQVSLRTRDLLLVIGRRPLA